MRLSILTFLLSSTVGVYAEEEYYYREDYDHYPDEVCLAKCAGTGSDEVCTFKFKLNQFASELGYYTVDGCEGIMPVLGMKQNVQYRFIQKDISNYYHPLGFAYLADGAHDGVDELEPSIVPEGSASKCGDDNTCPAPMYINSGKYLGKYSNIDEVAPSNGDEDFGLDVYEPQFFASPGDWQEAGKYEVALKFDVTDFTKDIVYFCHIHQYMSGKIKWVDEDGDVLQEDDDPKIPYGYERATAYDQSCGTYGVADFKLPNAQCPTEFVCKEIGIDKFAHCVDSMNCAMTAGMTTGASSNSAKALFVHQMIPHHQNAVNMAKALLNSGDLVCNDLTEETADCTLMVVCLEIITGQNHQIQSMRGAVEELGYPGEDDCTVQVSHVSSTGRFSLESTKEFKDEKYCAQQSASSKDLVVVKCDGSQVQQFKITLDGQLKAGPIDSKLCVNAKGTKVIVKKCTKGDSGTVTKSLNGGLAMVVKGETMFISLGGKDTEGEIPLKLRKESGFKNQGWHFNYIEEITSIIASDDESSDSEEGVSDDEGSDSKDGKDDD